MDVISSGEEAVGRLPIALGSDVIFANPSARSVAARSSRRETVDATEVWQQISAPQSNFQQVRPKPFNWGQIIIKDEQIVQSQKTLSVRVQQFGAEATSAQREELIRQEADFEQILAGIKAKQDEKEAKQKSKKIWMKKLGSGLEAFRDTAVHYQKILDVINSQAPEYTTPVWGALKLILLISTNQSDLKAGVEEHLKTIAHQFEIMRVLADLSPTQTTTDAVIEVYASFLTFLGEALKYYSEGRFKRGAKAFATPWEIRFKNIVHKIERGVTTVNQVAIMSHMVESKDAYEEIKGVRVGQYRTERRESFIYHQMGLGFQEVDLGIQEVLTGQDQGNRKVETSMQLQLNEIREIRERLGPILLKGGEDQKSTVRQTLQGLIESSQPNKLYETESESLATFAQRNKLKEFRDDIFPLLSKTDRDFASFFTILKPRPSNAYGNYFKLQSDRNILAWIETCTSRLLWIEGHMEKSDPYWNSNFALEVFCAAEKGASENPQTITALSFFCDDNASQRLNRPEVVAQSLLIQLIEKHRMRFSYDVCFEHQLTNHRFQDAAEDCASLWKLFGECLTISQTQCLYLVIDNVDILSLQCPNRSGKFHHLIEQLEKLVRWEGIVVKVLLTSRIPKLSEILFTTDSANRLVISLPRGGAQRTSGKSKESARVLRLPIEGPKEETIDLERIIEQGTIEQSSETEDGKSEAQQITDDEGNLSDDSFGKLPASQCLRWLNGSIDDSSDEGDELSGTGTKQYDESEDESDKNSLFEALRIGEEGGGSDDNGENGSQPQIKQPKETRLVLCQDKSYGNSGNESSNSDSGID